jgi:hypothetical protein
VNFDWLRLCQIDPSRQPSQLGMVFLVRTASLQFGFVSQSQEFTQLQWAQYIRLKNQKELRFLITYFWISLLIIIDKLI